MEYLLVEDDDMTEDEVQIVNSNTRTGSGSATVEAPSEEGDSSKPKKRKLRSIVWNYFTLKKEKNGTQSATCKDCNATYKYDGSTSVLNRHKCTKREGKDIQQMLLTANNGELSTRVQKIDQVKFREHLSVLIIRRNLPLSLVDYPEFRSLCSYLNEDVKHISRNTEKADILKIHKAHKDIIRNRLKLAPGKMCLTSDMWTSVTNTGYISLTVHYIDEKWVLHKHLLNFSPLPPPHTGDALMAKLFAMIEDWGIEHRVSNITLDNAANNGVCAGKMKNRLNQKKILFADGKYFHVRCCAHILALIVKEGLTMVDPAVIKIRKSVKFLKSSQVRKHKFLEIVDNLGMAGRRGIRQDVKTRWNSIYLMLDSCLLYKTVFTHLKEVDTDYKDSPTAEEWKQIEVVTKFLKIFYDLTTLFSGNKYPTSNLYFQGVCEVRLLLERESTNELEFIRNMVTEMKKKYDAYWKGLKPILAMAVVLDPRLKMKFVKFMYAKLYPDVRELERKADKVRSKMTELYEEYYALSNSRASTSATANGTQNFGGSQTGGNSAHHGSMLMQEFAAAQENGGDLEPDESELDEYLREHYKTKSNQPFDILTYWKGQEHRFPVLSRMAGDILSIPISTVASESAFSIGGRVIDKFRSSLLPENAEALITTNDWIYGVGKEDWDEHNGIIPEDVLGLEFAALNINREVADGEIHDG